VNSLNWVDVVVAASVSCGSLLVGFQLGVDATIKKLKKEGLKSNVN
jgi:hypothetical protein